MHCEIYLDVEKIPVLQYTIEDYIKGFFMELTVFPNEYQVSLAFDGGNQQLTYTLLKRKLFHFQNAF
jgi:hypothetical protein